MSIVCLAAMNAPVCALDPIVFVSAFKPGDEGAIHAYQFDSQSGKLKLLSRSTDLQHPFFMAISADRKFLYAIDAQQFGGEDHEFVAAFKIDPGDGTLTKLNRQSTRGTASCYLDIDATGRTVVLANYSTGSVAALPVNDDGSLGSATAFVQHIGSSVDPNRQKGPNAHSIVVSPDNRFVMAADLGIDKILIYRLNAASGTLTPSEAQPFVKLPPGSGPRHLTFHPNQSRMYVINELKNTVTCFEYAADTGKFQEQQTISTLPDDFSGISHTADVKISPDGKFLYGTNRGHDSIAVFRIETDGRLTLVNIEPSLGKGPQNLLITPDGGWLLCANMPGNKVVVFAIDKNTGKLTATDSSVTVPMPSCIRWLN